MTAMHIRHSSLQKERKQAGVTMVELMVALAVGSFLMIGAVQIYNQSRQAFVVNESIARVQETAQFAMDTIEADLRMASNWGQNSRPLAVEGRSIDGVPNPKSLTAPDVCGDDWPYDLVKTLDGGNNVYTLACAPPPGISAQPNSDLITMRRASVVAVPLTPGRLQIQTTRIQGELFDDGIVPATFSPDPTLSATHNVLVSSYYVAAPSDDNLIPGVPTLRRKTLAMTGGAFGVVDQEVAPGVENLQVQFGIDVNEDNTVDRYVNPGDGIYTFGEVGYVPGARVMTARVWLVVRGISVENGLQDTFDYNPGDRSLGTYSDSIRRMQVSKTILLRNTRT